MTTTNPRHFTLIVDQFGVGFPKFWGSKTVGLEHIPVSQERPRSIFAAFCSQRTLQNGLQLHHSLLGHIFGGLLMLHPKRLQACGCQTYGPCICMVTPYCLYVVQFYQTKTVRHISWILCWNWHVYIYIYICTIKEIYVYNWKCVCVYRYVYKYNLKYIYDSWWVMMDIYKYI